MKNNFKFIILSVISLLLFSGCTTYINYYEDKVYSEKIFSDYTSKTSINENSDIFTRDKAVEKVVKVFETGLNIKIDRSKLSESIKLYKDLYNESFNWQINWTDTTAKESYSSTVNSGNGQIVSIDITKIEPVVDDKGTGGTSSTKPSASGKYSKKLIDATYPLLSALGIDINKYVYSIYPASDLASEYYNPQQFAYMFYPKDKANGNDYFNIIVDSSTEKVIYYSNDPKNAYLRKVYGGMR